MAGPKKLFHTVVVVGASLGCGGATRGTGDMTDADMADRSPPARGEAGVGDTGACAMAMVLVCADAGGCRCVRSPPQSVCDCARPGEFRCRSCAIGDPPVNGRCLSGDGNGGGGDCFCDPSIVVAAPSDCPHSEQFTCTSFFGPTRFAACSPAAYLQRCLDEATSPLARAAVRDILVDEIHHARLGWTLIASDGAAAWRADSRRRCRRSCGWSPTRGSPPARSGRARFRTVTG